MRVNHRSLALLLATVAMTCTGQALTPAFIASPEIYKVRAMNDQYRIVEGTWKAGQRDAFHSHPPELYYWVTPCNLLSYLPDGTVSKLSVAAGQSGSLPRIESHSLQNVSEWECKVVILEPR